MVEIFRQAFALTIKESKIAYEIRSVSTHLGNKGFLLGYGMFGIDF